ncbi:helix-turn-helix transcriptional regulator [Yoonia sp. R2331]|uniref:helix-turn-helix transcriptional regulator n=1 Tax=Yoonia sp. R2331 TaxID=3237238 RepID=UPI0034E3F0E8
MGTHARIERLDRLEYWLKSDDPLILRDAAKELGVSLRTVHRDLDILRERGLPIEAERGRGGGVRLPSTWGIGRVSLTRGETLDLLIGLAIGETAYGAFQMGHSGAIRRKLLASFSHVDQRRIGTLRRRIRIGATASGAIVDSFSTTPMQISSALKEAFVLCRNLQIDYRDGQSQMTTREIEPHYLLVNPPVWYVICWDHLRGAPRTLRCDRIAKATLAQTPFDMRPWADFAPTQDGNPTHEV